MFYKTPKNIFSSIAEKNLISGSVLVINDHENSLADQIKKSGVEEIYTSTLDQIIDSDFWQDHAAIDWVVGVTQGLRDTTEWVTHCGMAKANKGICILDRITFLEPARQRTEILNSQTLSNIVILSPRPSFRADNRSLKDSVTSAWFVFSKDYSDAADTKIDFAINWDRPKIS
jgi:hypothetical protein